MNREQIIEMLWQMGAMTVAAMTGEDFSVGGISNYVRSHVPGIKDEYVEIFRDFLSPIIVQKKG